MPTPMETVYSPKPQPVLFSFAGIPVRVHRWLLIGLAFISVMAGSQTTGYSLAAAAGTLAALGVLFLAVLLHELAHAWVARRYGVDVVDITLWPLGGMATMRNMPEDPQIEMRIAVAGPLINLAIGGVCLLLWLAMHGSLDWHALRSTYVLDLSGLLSFTAVCHLALGLFNLVPAFPMDGGKILRSMLATRQDWLPATETAVRVGRWLGWGMLIASFFYGQWALAIIAIYLLVSGTKELWITRLRHPLEGQGPLADVFRKMREQTMPGTSSGPSPFESSGPDGEQDAERSVPTNSTGGLPRSSGGFTEEDIRAMEDRKDRLT